MITTASLLQSPREFEYTIISAKNTIMRTISRFIYAVVIVFVLIVIDPFDCIFFTNHR
jgi:hypothetical protein